MAGKSWYCVDAARQRHGPLDAEEIRRRFAAGELDRRSLVWRDGLPQWLPLGEMVDELGIATPAPPPVAAVTAETPGYRGDATPPSEGDAADRALEQAYAASPRDASALPGRNVDAADVVDAGFLRRLAALMIDGVLLGVATYALLILMLIVVGAGTGGLLTLFEASATGQPPSGPLLIVFVLGLYVLPFVMRWAYFTYFTSSAWQATPGKRAVGIKVVDLEGRRIGRGRAAGRWFAAALSYLTFYIGFLMAAFTDRKQALHDLVASTRVVDQWAYTAHPERQQRGVGGCAIAALVGIALFAVVAVAGMIAAISLPAYQDYASRTRLAPLMDERYALQAAIDEFHFNTDRCPASFDELGIDAPTRPMVAEAQLGEAGPGQCSVRWRLGGPSAAEFDGEFLWFTRGEDGGWTCGGSMADALLPPECRG
jgi:uncharacterized RDD family membrane protein YckC